MNIPCNWRAAAAAAALGFAAIGPASAHSIAVMADINNYTFVGAAVVVLPSMTSPLFANAAGQRIIARFSSECAVNAAAGNTSAWTDVDIVVLNAVGAVVQTMTPTAGAGDAFCASNGTAGFDGWETNSVTAFGGTGLPAGNYRVQVRARLNGGATGGWFGERSLVIER
ncbi:hypothetical protein V4F39_18405 [Aquincola sp. MAHUQ-54]|uniref:Uncharacterized protein n=1 Tax=Aquincola agrisoli TaxID=3119538 RepID=A0AAW9QHS0_9BURK